MSLLEITELQDRLREFAERRNWTPLHTPKNLAMAIAGEAGELVAVLQWEDGAAMLGGSDLLAAVHQDLADEMADVMIYLARLADVANVDLCRAVEEKNGTQ